MYVFHDLFSVRIDFHHENKYRRRAGAVGLRGVFWPLLYHWFDSAVNFMVPEGRYDNLLVIVTRFNGLWRPLRVLHRNELRFKCPEHIQLIGLTWCHFGDVCLVVWRYWAGHSWNISKYGSDFVNYELLWGVQILGYWSWQGHCSTESPGVKYRDVGLENIKFGVWNGSKNVGGWEWMRFLWRLQLVSRNNYEFGQEG